MQPSTDVLHPIGIYRIGKKPPNGLLAPDAAPLRFAPDAHRWVAFVTHSLKDYQKLGA